jgi:hypothetical protein
VCQHCPCFGAAAKLHDQPAVLRELQHLVIGHGLEPRQSVGGAIVATHPHEALVVEMDPVLAFGPFIAVARSAPGLDETASRVEHHHRRRGHRGFFGLERSRPMQKPDVILSVDGEAGRISELPFRRHFRPRSVHLERGQTAGLGLDRLAAQDCARPPRRDGASKNDHGCQSGTVDIRALHGSLHCSFPRLAVTTRSQAAPTTFLQELPLAGNGRREATSP